MAEEIMDRLVKEIDRLGTRFDELDKRMRKFETVAVAGAMIALFFGISAGVGGLVLKAEWEVFDKVRQDTVAVGELSSQVTKLQDATSTISSAIDKASLPVLLTRIKDFTSETIPPHYGYADYVSDTEALANFAVEYLTLLENKNASVNPQDSATLFLELNKAADAATARANTGLKPLGDKYYESHVRAPQDFKNLLKTLQSKQDTGLSLEEVHCYLAAFPNWFYHINHDMNDSPNTPSCQKLLEIGPA